LQLERIFFKILHDLLTIKLIILNKVFNILIYSILTC